MIDLVTADGQPLTADEVQSVRLRLLKGIATTIMRIEAHERREQARDSGTPLCPNSLCYRPLIHLVGAIYSCQTCQTAYTVTPTSGGDGRHPFTIHPAVPSMVMAVGYCVQCAAKSVHVAGTALKCSRCGATHEVC